MLRYKGKVEIEGIDADIPSLETSLELVRKGDALIRIVFMYLQAEYMNFVELKEPIIREAEEAITKGTMVQSAGRFLEGLEQSRAPYNRTLELLEAQVRLAKEKKNQQWLKQAAIGADRARIRSREWICRNIYDIGPRRQRPQTVRDREIERIN